MPNRKDKKRGPKYEVRGGAPTRSNDSRSNAPSQNFKKFPHEMVYVYTVPLRYALDFVNYPSINTLDKTIPNPEPSGVSSCIRTISKPWGNFNLT